MGGAMFARQLISFRVRDTCLGALEFRVPYRENELTGSAHAEECHTIVLSIDVRVDRRRAET